jgi:hypothetical protein
MNQQWHPARMLNRLVSRPMQETSDKSKHFAWLVRRRSEIQAHCLELRGFARTAHPEGGRDDVYTLLIGSAFSLWRAVFLVPETKPTSDVIWEKAAEFLDILIEDNAIAYPQDKRTRQWMFGYYRNNAYFRLQEVERRLETSNGDGATLPSSVTALYEMDGYEAWDMLFSAQKRFWEDLNSGSNKDAGSAS